MDTQLLDFGTCVGQARHSAKDGICPHFDPDCGVCRRCDELCEVYAHYLVKQGTSFDLMEFWGNQRLLGRLLMHQTSRP